MKGMSAYLQEGQVYLAVSFEGHPLRYTILKLYEDKTTYLAKQEPACLRSGAKVLPKDCPNDFFTTLKCAPCVNRLLSRRKRMKQHQKLMVNYTLEKYANGEWNCIHTKNYPALKFFNPSLPNKVLMEVVNYG